MEPVRTPVRQAARNGGRAFTRHLLALLLATALTVAGLAFTTTPVASAASPLPGLNTSIDFAGGTHNGRPVLGENVEGTLRIQYDNSESLKGQVIDIEMPEGLDLGEFTGSNANVTVSMVDGKLRLTFATSFPSAQGVIALKFKYSNVERSEIKPFTYTVAGTPVTEEIVILNGGDEIANVNDNLAKSNAGALNGHVSVVNGQVRVAAAIIGAPINYTLTFDQKTGDPAFAISDTLPPGLAFGNTFTWATTSWDENGLNKTQTTTSVTPALSGTPATGHRFDVSLDVASPSRNTLKYTASVADEAARLALQAALQAEYDKVKDNENGGDYKVNLTNSATLDGTTKTSTLAVGGRVNGPAKPNVGQGFDKQADWTSQDIGDGLGGDTLPVGITWRLNANLAVFNGTTNDYHRLDRNVVIKDTLPQQATWDTGAADFLSATGGLTLTEVSACSTSTGTFADTAPGSWCVSGQTLMVNLGQDNTLKTTISAKAQINSVQGLSAGWTPVVGGKAWTLRNSADFTYSTAATPAEEKRTDNEDVTLINRGDGTNGYDDSSSFRKSGPSNKLVVDPITKRATVKYAFDVMEGKGLNAADLAIVDRVDTSVFDLTDLAAIKATVTGTYNWQPLTSDDFDVTLAGGDLTIRLSDAGKAKATPANKQWNVNLTLTTLPINGKQTISITNHADLVGEGEEVLYFSETTSEATTYGDEAEVRKAVRNSDTGAWTQNLRAEMNEDGTLKKSVYVYRVEFLAHNNYHGLPMIPVVDKLPEGVEFVGFVDEANADTGAGASTAPKDLGHNIRATYDGVDSITMSSTANLAQGTRVSAYFAVRIETSTADVPIVNTVSGSSATITPTDGFPIAVAKVDADSPSTVINDRDARFELLDADGVVVVGDIFVVDGLLRVDDDGVVKGVKVTKPGTYTLREVIPPTGYVRSEQILTVVVEPDTVPDAQTFLNTKVGPSVTVGDYVWIDKNHDGRQDATDVPVKGVELKIQKVAQDGTLTDVTGVDNMPVPPRRTDAEGRYLFELLPVLTEGETYRVTIVDTPTALEGFVPTAAGDDNGSGATDSSTEFSDTTGDLTTGGAEDLTLDFGFVSPYVSVGNYVWIDVNKDGRQDATDVPIKGVKLALVGPDGQPVTEDVYGDPIVDQVTDADGHYLFDNLPPLGEGPDGQQLSYTVTIVRDDAATVAALTGLAPTTEGADGGSGSDDSSEWTASSTKPLTEHRAQDLTLDFGFIRLAVSVGDYVWEDVNRDGTQGSPATEPGIEGVLLEILGPDGEVVTHDVDGKPLPEVRTDANGRYSFDNLPALADPEDSYTVKIVRDDPATVEALKPFVPTTAGPDNGSGDTDSSLWEAESTQDLTSDTAHDPTLDFGFVKKYVSVGDHVWIDVNRDGLQDGSDRPVPGVTLHLVMVEDGVESAVVNVLGEPVTGQTTDADGNYLFDHLPVLKQGQTYRVTIDRSSLPSMLDTYQPTQAQVGDDEAVDSDTWTAETSRTVHPLTTHLDHDPSLDFGFVQKKVSVGNIVWIDSDVDGVRDPEEEPIPGVTLTITRTDGEPVTDVYGNPVTEQVTDSDGVYGFDDLPALPPGTHYVVTIDPTKSPILTELNLVPTTPGDRGDDTDPDTDYSHTDSAESRDLTEDGDHDPTLDFGFRKAKVSVGNYVWVDVNRDGLQDRSDVAIKGVVLALTGPDGQPVTDVFGQPVGTTTTDAAGHYEFTNLPVLAKGQSYTTTIVADDPSTQRALKGLLPTTAGAGSDRGRDSSTGSAKSWRDLTTDGAQDLTLDYGFVTPEVAGETEKNPGGDVAGESEENPDRGDGDATGETNGPLPDTGAPAAGPIILGAFGLLLAGALVLVARHRRRA